MIRKLNLRKKLVSKRITMLYKMPLMLILLLTILPVGARGGFVHSSPNYGITIGEFSGAPGDTAWMPIYFKNTPIDTLQYWVLYEPTPGVIDSFKVNDSGKLGGGYLRFRYDSLDAYEVPITSNLLTPIVDYADIQNVVIDTITGDTLSADTTSYVFKFRMVGRGLGAISYHTVPPYDFSYYHIQPKHEPADDITAYTMSVLWTPVIDTTGWTMPVIEPYPGSTVVMEIPFLVNEFANHHDDCLIEWKDATFRANQFSSLDGLLYILPLQHDGWFRVDTAGANARPEIEFSPSAASYYISPGASIPTITVTGRDLVDNDFLCLTTQHNLPGSPSFSPSDSVCGTGTAQMTFNWTSSAADDGQTYTVYFTADDYKLNGDITSSISITVSGSGPTNDPPVVASITPNSYVIEQGEALPTINVSATDPDGDSLWLEVIGMPGNATFVGIPSLYGRGTVNATFNWMPSFADVGLYTISFRATDSAGATGTQTIFVTVEVPDVDRLFSKSTYGTGTRPVGGIRGATPVIFPIDLISTRTVYGINFDMTYPGAVVEIDSVVVTDRTPEYVVYENIGAYPDSLRIVTFGLSNEPIISATSTAILNAYFSIDTAASPGDYWVHFYDAWESVDPDPEIASLALKVDSGIIQVDMLGDVNLDKHIDVADLVNVVGYIIGNYSLAKRNYEAANIVTDSIVNVVDLIGILNYIFGWPIGPSPGPMGQSGEVASLDIEHDDLVAGQMTKLRVQGEFPEDVAGIQLQIDYDPNAIQFERPELANASDKFRLVYRDNWSGRIKILLYSEKPWDSKTLIPAGISDIVHLPVIVREKIDADDDTKIRITQAYLSNSSAGEIPTKGNNTLLPTTFTLHQNYPNPFNPITKINFDIGCANDASTKHVNLKIFNILGRRVKTLINDDLTAGQHSVTWDATDDKGRNVATGIYLYRLEVEDKHQTKKMLLLK